MENNKLSMGKKLSQLKKGIVIPALLAAGLNCFAATSRNTTYSKSTSLGNKTLVYEKASSKYNEQKALNTMNAILNSDLNKMTGYDRLEAQVQNEVAGYLAEMNANSLELARLYKSLEDHTIANSGMSLEQINQIAANNGVGTSDEVNVQVVRSAIQHYVQMFFDTNSSIRLRADEAEIAILDEGDGHNENVDVITHHLRLKNKGKRSLREEATAVLNAAETDILNYTQYEYTIKGQNGKQMANKISGNMSKIKLLVSKAKFNQNDYNALLKLVIDTADILPESMYGTLAMRRGLIIEFASQYAMNHLLTVMANLGYDIDNIQPGVFVEQGTKQNVTLNPSASVSVTNQHVGTGVGLTATNPLGKNWDITYGGEINANKGFKGGLDSLQLLTSANLGKTLKNDDKVSFGTKAGVQFDAKGASTPFGMQAGYTWNINDNFSLDFGVNSLLNIQRSLMDIGTSVGATYRGKNWTVGFSLNLGYTATWNKDHNINPLPDPLPQPEPTPDDPTIDKPTQPTPPIYESDQGSTPGSSSAAEKELPVDISSFFSK